MGLKSSPDVIQEKMFLVLIYFEEIKVYFDSGILPFENHLLGQVDIP